MSAPGSKRVFDLARWPAWASRWLGYRASPKPETQRDPFIWSFIGSFSAIAVLQAIFGYTSYFQDRGVPSIVGSFGASAVLCFDVIASPLSQPRALVGGHFLSALVGVCITRLIHVGRVSQPEYLQWFAGALSTAIAIVVMRATKTTHAPAGATALLAAVDSSIYNLGWYYIPVILLSSVIVLVLALFFNNISRRYPVYWIEPAVPPKPAPAPAAVPAERFEMSSGENRTKITEGHTSEPNGGAFDLERGSNARL